jgi:hypothetical protein
MKSGVPERSWGIGLAGSVVGMLALIAVIIPQWVLPPPPRPASVEAHQTLAQRLVEKLKRMGHKHEKKREPAGWREGLPAIAIFLALLAVFLGAFSILRGEVQLHAGVAATLGIGAIAYQLTFGYAVAASVILIMYAAMERPGGAFALALIAACAVVVLAILAILGMGLFSALVLMGAAMAILSLNMLRG